MFTCYVISLPSRVDRREKMARRLESLHLKYKFVDAFTPDSQEVLWMGRGYDLRAHRIDPKLKCTIGSELACFASHLAALKMVFESGVPGIVLEDDAVLHRDFVQCLGRVDFTDLPLLMLYSEPQCNAKGPGLHKIENNWGAVGFWICPDYAHEAYRRFHRPCMDSDFPIKTSEAILMCSEGKYIIPQLVLEDPMNISCLRDSNAGNGYHLQFSKLVNYSDYTWTEGEEYQSLLKNYFLFQEGKVGLFEIESSLLDVEQQYIHFKISGDVQQLQDLIKNNPERFWFSTTPRATFKRVFTLDRDDLGMADYGLRIMDSVLEIDNIDSKVQELVDSFNGTPPKRCISLSDEPGAYLLPREQMRMADHHGYTGPVGTQWSHPTDCIQGPILCLRDPINVELTRPDELSARIIRTKKNHLQFDYNNFLSKSTEDYKVLLREFLGHYVNKKCSYDLFGINKFCLSDIQLFVYYDLVLIYSYTMCLSSGAKYCKEFLKFARTWTGWVEPRIDYFIKNMEYYIPARDTESSDSGKKSMLMVAFSGLDYNGDSVKKGIFGSEEAVIYLTAALTEHYNITVLTGHPNKVHALPFNNPRYMKTLIQSGPVNPRFDVGVCWRNYQPVGGLCDQVWSWHHDVYTPDWTRERLLEMDRVLLLSEWQREQFSACVSMEDVPVKICGNGIVPRDFSTEITGPRTCTNPYAFVYTSCYARGLVHLLRWWPEIKRDYPTATLDLCYGWYLWNQPEHEQKELKAQFERVKHMDIRDHGTVGHLELLKIMKSCSIWAYPCIFLETFCITGVKMQACGVVPIVNKIGALKETVSHGYQCEDRNIGGGMGKYKELLFQSLKSLQTDWHLEGDQRKDMSRAVLEKYSWKKTAESWV